MCKSGDTRTVTARRLRSSVFDGLVGKLLRFGREEAGNMSLLTIFGSMSLVALGGVGIDLMYAEMKRTKVQATLDRAVLAAADLDQTLDPEGVMRDYFDKMLMPEALTSVSVTGGLNYRKVTGTAHVDMPSNFTSMLGVEGLKADGTATAEEHIKNVEVSLVLDISGSMGENNRLVNMKSAANTFIDTLLTSDNAANTSISLVPYSEHVNAGPSLTSALNVNWQHSYSHCIEFDSADYDSTGLNMTKQYAQMQHFQWNYFGGNDLTDTICPRYYYERIQPLSKDAAKLKNQVNALQPRAGTQIFMGMKWGAALLNPSSQPLTVASINAGLSDPSFSNRPAALTDANTLKTIVLMTDGQNSDTYRLANWAYDSANDRAHWASYNLWYYLQRNVAQRNWPAFYWQKYDGSGGDYLLDNICEAAKNDGIVVWTVGFETTEHGKSVMRDCASSPSHYFEVQGTEIEDAFSSIARSINQLRLTQ